MPGMHYCFRPKLLLAAVSNIDLSAFHVLVFIFLSVMSCFV